MTAGPGDRHRAAMLARLRDRLAAGAPANLAHPAPDADPQAPRPTSRVVDSADLVGTLARTATEAGAVVHRCPAGDAAGIGSDVLAAVVGPLAPRSAGGRAVLSADPEAQALRAGLEGLDWEVADHSPAVAATADLGVTGSTAAIAATGSVVLDAARAGGRGAGLLPPVHLCVVRASTVVAQTADVLRPLAGHPERLGSNLLLVTGPSRTGDIEQILTVGVHGPAQLHLLLLDGA